ncbi:hypothetical protein GW17_00059470, partial [Ensete ventricosum]
MAQSSCTLPSAAVAFMCSSFHHRGRGPQLPPPLTNTSKASSIHGVVVCSLIRYHCCHPQLSPSPPCSSKSSSITASLSFPTFHYRCLFSP